MGKRGGGFGNAICGCFLRHNEGRGVVLTELGEEKSQFYIKEKVRGVDSCHLWQFIFFTRGGECKNVLTLRWGEGGGEMVLCLIFKGDVYRKRKT